MSVSIDIIKRAANNDISALRKVVSNHGNLYDVIMGRIINQSTRREAMLEKNVFFYNICKLYDETKGASFTTFAYQKAIWRRWELLKRSKMIELDFESEQITHPKRPTANIKDAISSLDSRAQYIFKRRFFDDKKASFEEIGKEINLTVEGVRVVYKKNLKKLKKNKLLAIYE